MNWLFQFVHLEGIIDDAAVGLQQAIAPYSCLVAIMWILS